MILAIENYVHIQRIKVEGNKPKLRNTCLGSFSLFSPLLPLPFTYFPKFLQKMYYSWEKGKLKSMNY